MLILLATIICQSASGKVFSVLVDPGHGGRDRGTSRGNVVEADIVLKIGLKLEDLLKKDPTFKVALTRRTDRFLALSSRSTLARELDVDLLVSLHLNSSPEERAKGVEFYFQNQLPPDEEALFLAAKENNEGEELAAPDIRPSNFSSPLPKDREVQLILEDLVHNERVRKSSRLAQQLFETWLGPKKSASRAIKQAPFRVISAVGNPSVLVEMGYLSNREDAEALTREATHDQIALGIYRGLVKFREFVDTRPHAF